VAAAGTKRSASAAAIETLFLSLRWGSVAAKNDEEFLEPRIDRKSSIMRPSGSNSFLALSSSILPSIKGSEDSLNGPAFELFLTDPSFLSGHCGCKFFITVESCGALASIFVVTLRYASSALSRRGPTALVGGS
jgi:hypothetical protein